MELLKKTDLHELIQKANLVILGKNNQVFLKKYVL